VSTDFERMMADANDVQNVVHGSEISYTPSGGSPTPITARVTRRGLREVDTEHGTRIAHTLTAAIDDDQGVTPDEGDQLTVAGATWHVAAVDGPVGGTYIVHAGRYADGEESPEGFRPDLVGIE